MTTKNECYVIEKRTPDIDDYMRLRQTAGLTPFSRAAAEIGLEGTVFAVVVVVDGEVIGMGRLIGDGGCFFQVTDIAVQPDHQGRGLGKAIMTAIMEYVDTTMPETAYVSLIADVPANKLYEQFGFNETAPRSVGMSYIVR
ncbi:GNAT family N-acetyltransferase (plasmid) [Aliirhizobium terrae]|uniref:GNAT family N-acetyltransferase n=1 Tax=Terrirhizobium terrae TaxID=2926709 RepID=UPI002574B55A|nr:GNAT family N-acetyltransferase [Rhizobium sp. CC-CFT758]WJH38458.1 GNAT family N-acetyltransferase [Rhizobium sp. CC-CFT758]